MSIDQIEFNLKAPGAGEYDIVAANGHEVVVLEVKNKLNPDHLQHFVKVQLPRFKQLFPIFADYTLYGAVGSLVVPEQIEQQAEKMGLFVFTQTAEGGAGIVNRDDFHARAW